MLTLTDVYVAYGAITALRGVSLQVNEGEIVGLVGVNGAGKSTLLLTITGVLRPVRGSIAFLGESIAGRSPENIVRKGISLVPEGRRIFPGLTVEENLRLGAASRGGDRDEMRRDIEKIFARFPILSQRSRQMGGTLSGGEQQQLAIARALMSHPRLILLDEPSLGLAPQLVDEIFRLVQELREGGVTVLLVEQNVERALEISNRCYLLNTGRVEFAGTPAELRECVDIVSAYLGRLDGPQERRQ